MSMVFCRGCGKELHESAPTCPQCGAPQGNLNSVIKDVTTYFKELKRKKQEEKLKQEVLNHIQYKKELNRRKQQQEEESERFKKMKTYRDPSYQRRQCSNCSAIIDEGRVYCFSCNTMQE